MVNADGLRTFGAIHGEHHRNRGHDKAFIGGIACGAALLIELDGSSFVVYLNAVQSPFQFLSSRRIHLTSQCLRQLQPCEHEGQLSSTMPMPRRLCLHNVSGKPAPLWENQMIVSREERAGQ